MFSTGFQIEIKCFHECFANFVDCTAVKRNYIADTSYATDKTLILVAVLNPSRVSSVSHRFHR